MNSFSAKILIIVKQKFSSVKFIYLININALSFKSAFVSSENANLFLCKNTLK